MIRIAHCADLHLGYRALTKTVDGRNARAVDVERSFNAMIDQMRSAKPDLAIIAGDIFHMPRPPYGAVSLFITGVNALLEDGIRVAAIAGNHDTSTLRTRDDVFTVIRASCPGLMMASGDEQVFETFHAGSSQDFVKLNLIASRKLKSYYPPTAPAPVNCINVMAVHGIASDIPSAKIAPAPGEEQIANDLLSQQYDYIAMGDWHQWGRVRPNAWYSGSIERFGWGDLPADPGWLLAEVGAFEGAPRVSHHRLPARHMVDLGKLNVMDSEPQVVARAVVEACADRGNSIADALKQPWERDEPITSETMVRVELTDVPDRAYGRQVRDVLSHVKGKWWHITVNEQLRGRPELLSDGTVEYVKPDPIEEFAKYVAAINKPDEFKRALLEKGLAHLKAAAQKEAEREMTD